MVTLDCQNMLHHAILDERNDVEEKVISICRHYPHFIHQRDLDGHTPLHNALHTS